MSYSTSSTSSKFHESETISLIYLFGMKWKEAVEIKVITWEKGLLAKSNKERETTGDRFFKTLNA